LRESARERERYGAHARARERERIEREKETQIFICRTSKKRSKSSADMYTLTFNSQKSARHEIDYIK